MALLRVVIDVPPIIPAKLYYGTVHTTKREVLNGLTSKDSTRTETLLVSRSRQPQTSIEFCCLIPSCFDVAYFEAFGLRCSCFTLSFHEGTVYVAPAKHKYSMNMSTKEEIDKSSWFAPSVVAPPIQ